MSLFLLGVCCGYCGGSERKADLDAEVQSRSYDISSVTETGPRRDRYYGVLFGTSPCARINAYSGTPCDLGSDLDDDDFNNIQLSER